MLIIKTVYPCKNCSVEISPLVSFCPKCGAKQPDLEDTTFYNVFYRTPGSEVFNIRYGGDPILELNDVIEDFYDSNMNSSSYEYFVGAFKGSSRPYAGEKLTVLQWLPLGEAEIGEDQGEREISITFLE